MLPHSLIRNNAVQDTGQAGGPAEVARTPASDTMARNYVPDPRQIDGHAMGSGTARRQACHQRTMIGVNSVPAGLRMLGWSQPNQPAGSAGNYAPELQSVTQRYPNNPP
jgi:hypothetical protein